MKNQIGRREKFLVELRNTAVAAWERRDFALFFNLLHQALEAEPANTMILLDLGNGYGHQADFPKAIQYFERAVESSREKSRVLAIVGTHCRGFLRFDLATEYLERAVREPGVQADTWARLGEMRERMRDKVGAEAAMEAALKLDSKCALALLLRSRLRRTEGLLDDAEATVRSLVARTDRAGWASRIGGWYELAEILDRQGRYDEAIEALKTAKGMIMPNAAAALAAQRERHRKLKGVTRELTASQIEAWRQQVPEASTRRLALIAGHPRSGTTLLEQILDAHSNIVSAEETGFFPDLLDNLRIDEPPSIVGALNAISESTLRSARETYFRQIDAFLGESARDKLVVDKNPSLTYRLSAFTRIFPEARIIIPLRDPRDVCISCFMQALNLNGVSAMYLSLEGTVEEYCTIMGSWLAVQPLLPATLEVRYEDVVTNMQHEAERTLRFLDLEWEPAISDFTSRAQRKVVMSPTYAAVAKPLHKGAIGRWKNYRKHLEPHLNRLAPFVKAFGYEPA